MTPAPGTPTVHDDRWGGWIVEAAPTAMVLADAAWTIRLVNPRAERVLGRGRDGLLGRSLVELIPDLASVVHETACRAPVDQARAPFDLTCYRDDGERVPLAVECTPIDTANGSLCLVTLVASPDRSQRDERLRMIVEATPNAVLITDARGVITMLNHKAEILFDYTRADLVGRSVEVLLPEPLRGVHASHVRAFHRDPASRTMGMGRELPGLRRDGTEVPLEIGLEPIQTPDGPFTLVSMVDITARKAQDDELRRSNAELEQFAYVASHDLQEPLRMVASYTELLSQRYKGRLDERADKYIFYAVDGAKRMQRLVADLLAYSRIGSQGRPLVRVSADVVWRGVVQSLDQQIAEAGAIVEAGPLPFVLADEGQLRQLFQNLLANAIKFRGEVPPHVTMAATPHDDTWTFSVRDNGIGIELAHAGRIFQMFQRLHERGKYEGSGIGLAIAKRIVERHGGRIWFESAVGVGTAFHFTLLAAKDPA
jgi:PAS domain S-box-containing protein